MLILAPTAGPGIGIAYNNSADLGGSDTIASLTVLYSLGAGSNLLIVLVDGSNTIDDITSVTYAGQPMSLAWKVIGTANYDYLYFYYLLGPASGTNNVVVTAATAHRIRAIAADYTGVRQSGQPDAVSPGFNATGTPGAMTDTVTTVANNCWAILGHGGYNVGLPPTNGTGSTRRIYGAFYGMPTLFDSNGPLSPAGPHSMTINNAAGSIQIASFAPA